MRSSIKNILLCTTLPFLLICANADGLSTDKKFIKNKPQRSTVNFLVNSTRSTINETKLPPEKIIYAGIDINGFWKSFKSAYRKKESSSLMKLIQFPIRENVINSKYGDNPSLSMAQFFAEANYLKKYDLDNSSPVINNRLRMYASFEHYKFNSSDLLYEVKLRRYSNPTSGFAMTLYIKANNEVFKLFAFDPETSFNDVGD
jgi:hypothetical protein